MDAKNELYGLTRLRDRSAAPAKGVQQFDALLLADVEDICRPALCKATICASSASGGKSRNTEQSSFVS